VFSRRLGRHIFCLVLMCRLAGARADIASTQPDLGPKDAFRAFLLDLSQGRPADLADVCVTRQEDSRSVLRDFQTVATAIGHLRAAVAKRFGADAIDSVMPQMALPESVDDMTETDKPDEAMLNGAEAGTVRMVKTGGAWKVDLDWLRKSPDFPAWPPYFRQLAQVIQRTADDITRGRLDSASSALEALRARQDGIPDGPATEPTTQP
jgi:hypothetical protein